MVIYFIDQNDNIEKKNMNINLVLFLSLLNDRRNADHQHETNEYFLLSLARGKKKFKLESKGLKKKIKAI